MNRLLLVLFVTTGLIAESRAQKSIATSVRQATTDTTGRTWLLGFNYQTAFLTATKGWQLHPSNFRARYITAAPGGTFYAIGYDDKIYRDAGKKFALVDPEYRARRLAVDASGTLWIIGLTDEVFYRRDDRWRAYPGNQKAKELVLDRAGRPYVIGMDNRVYTTTETGWQVVAGTMPKAVKIAFDNRNRLWLIDTANELYGEIKPRQWNRYPGRRSRDIVFGKGQTLYFVGYWNNRLYRENLKF
jgi:hypothetical protein